MVVKLVIYLTLPSLAGRIPRAVRELRVALGERRGQQHRRHGRAPPRRRLPAHRPSLRRYTIMQGADSIALKKGPKKGPKKGLKIHLLRTYA